MTQAPSSTRLFNNKPDTPEAAGNATKGEPAARRGPKRKVNLTDFATPASAVSAFCRAVLLKLVPPQFFGDGLEGLANRKIIMKHVDTFIRMRRFESPSLHEVCSGLKVRSRRHYDDMLLTKSIDHSHLLASTPEAAEFIRL